MSELDVEALLRGIRSSSSSSNKRIHHLIQAQPKGLKPSTTIKASSSLTSTSRRHSHASSATTPSLAPSKPAAKIQAMRSYEDKGENEEEEYDEQGLASYLCRADELVLDEELMDLGGIEGPPLAPLATPKRDRRGRSNRAKQAFEEMGEPLSSSIPLPPASPFRRCLSVRSPIKQSAKQHQSPPPPPDHFVERPVEVNLTRTCCHDETPSCIHHHPYVLSPDKTKSKKTTSAEYQNSLHRLFNGNPPSRTVFRDEGEGGARSSFNSDSRTSSPMKQRQQPQSPQQRKTRESSSSSDLLYRHEMKQLRKHAKTLAEDVLNKHRKLVDLGIMSEIDASKILLS